MCSLLDLPVDTLHQIAQHVMSSGVAPPMPDIDQPKHTPTLALGLSGIGVPASDDINKASITTNAAASSSSAHSTYSKMGSNVNGKAASPTPISSKNIYSLIPDPRALLPLMLTAKKVYGALRFEDNPTLYQWMYMETFDCAALIRRWKRYQYGGLNHSYTSVEALTQTEHEDDNNTCDVDHEGKECTCREGVHLLTDPKIFANEYRERFDLFKLYRTLSKGGVLKEMWESKEGRQTISAGIWVAWWMYMENDHKNMLILNGLAKFRSIIHLFYSEVMLEEALQPGWPENKTEIAIMAVIANNLGVDAEVELTREQIETKVFILLPYVFGMHKFPFLLGPWVHRDLPLTRIAKDAVELQLLSRPNAFMEELSPIARSTTVKRLGKHWKVSPPFHTMIASISFMQLLDRHPELITLGKNPHVSTLRPGAPANPAKKAPFRTSRNVTSKDFDMDLNRAMSCYSPITSPGMHPLSFRHQLEGIWLGKYVYFDYNAYQHMVKGDIRSLYEGTYGTEAQEWHIQERVINVKIDKVGGDGSMLTAGYRTDMSPEDEQYEASLSAEERGWEPCLDEGAPDRPGWTKEILLSGVGRSAWGDLKLIGRVRAWDGLVTIYADYGIPASTGKWLFRCYVHSNEKLLGRYRDTFTPENMRGYEGPVFLQKSSPSPPPAQSTVQNGSNSTSPLIPEVPAFDGPAASKRLQDSRKSFPSESYTLPPGVGTRRASTIQDLVDPLDEPVRTSTAVPPPISITDRARQLAAHRANLAAQPILPLVTPASPPPPRRPLHLPPIEAPPMTYRNGTYAQEAERAQNLWSRSLASDIGSKRDGIVAQDEWPKTKRRREY